MWIAKWSPSLKRWVLRYASYRVVCSKGCVHEWQVQAKLDALNRIYAKEDPLGNARPLNTPKRQ